MAARHVPELPEDIVQVIVSHLGGRDADAADLAAARSVCQTWRRAVAAAVHTVQPAALPAAEIAAAFPKLRALDLSRMALPPADPQTVEAVGLVDVARLPLVLPGLTAVLLDGCRLCGLDDLAALSRLPALEHLALACKWLAKTPPPAALPLPPALTFLALSDGVPSFLRLSAQRDLSQLGQLRHLHTLQLEAWRPVLIEAELRGLVPLAGSLRHLSLVGSVGAAGGALAPLTRLTALNLRHCKSISYSALARLPRLEVLALPTDLGSPASYPDESVYRALEQLTRLQHLELSGSRTVVSCKLLATSPAAARLRTLRMQHSALDTDMAFPPDVWTSLESLDLSTCYGVGPATVEAVCQYLTRLTCLDLGYCNTAVTEGGCKQIAAQLTRLQRLGMCDGDLLSAEGMAAVMGLPQLRRLDISDSGVSLQPLPAAGLVPAPQLTALDVGGWTMSLETVERLAAVCPGLRELRGNSVTFGGGCGEALAELTCLTALHLPWVTTKDMPDAGYVGGLARLPRLHTLEVSHSRAVGLAACHLAPLHGMKSLRALWCRGVRGVRANSFVAHSYLRLYAGKGNEHQLERLCASP